LQAEQTLISPKFPDVINISKAIGTPFLVGNVDDADPVGVQTLF